MAVGGEGEVYKEMNRGVRRYRGKRLILLGDFSLKEVP